MEEGGGGAGRHVHLEVHIGPIMLANRDLLGRRKLFAILRSGSGGVARHLAGTSFGQSRWQWDSGGEKLGSWEVFWSRQLYVALNPLPAPALCGRLSHVQCRVARLSD